MTNRRPINRHHRPGPTAVTLKQFDRMLEIEIEGSHERWEEEGGHRREHLDLAGDIFAALAVYIAEHSPAFIDHEYPPVWVARYQVLWDKWVAARNKLLDQRTIDHRRLLEKLNMTENG